MPYVDYRRSRYRASPVSPWRDRHGAARVPLWEFVLLSMLLHALAIALFGAPSGGSRQGHSMWGSLTVVLQAAAPDDTPSLRMDRTIPRLTPLAKPRPQARARRALGPTKPAAQPAAPPHSPIEAPSAPATPVVPPLMHRIETPPDEIAPTVPAPTAVRPPAPIVVPTPAPLPPPVAPAPVDEAPLPPPATQEAPASPPPVEQAPKPAAPAAPAPVEAPALPVPDANATPPVPSAPLESHALPVPDVATHARDEAPPPPAPAEPAAKAPSEVAPALPEEAPATLNPPAPVEPAPVISAPPAASTHAPPSPSKAPEPAAPAARAIEEAPSPFRQQGPSSDYDPTAPANPALELDRVRRHIGELAREGSGQRAVLPFPMPAVPPKKSKLETAIENARKPDCRTAYQALGLAAVVPLIANEFGEGNCRW